MKIKLKSNFKLVFFALLVTFIFLLILPRLIKILELTYKQSKYDRLKALLASKKWEEADKQTAEIIALNALDGNLIKLKSKRFRVSFNKIEKIPCQDLITIDKVWSQYSNEKFGLKIQQHIWQSFEPQEMYEKGLDEKRTHLEKTVGWTDSNLLKPNVDVPEGYYPSQKWLLEFAPPLAIVKSGIDQELYSMSTLYSQFEKCNIQEN